MSRYAIVVPVAAPYPAEFCRQRPHCLPLAATSRYAGAQKSNARRFQGWFATDFDGKWITEYVWNSAWSKLCKPGGSDHAMSGADGTNATAPFCNSGTLAQSDALFNGKR